MADLMQNDQMETKQGRPELFGSPLGSHIVEEPVRENECGATSPFGISNELGQRQRDMSAKCIAGDCVPMPPKVVKPQPPGNKPKSGKTPHRGRKKG